MNRVYIEIRGGAVAGVYADDRDLEIILVDRDELRIRGFDIPEDLADLSIGTPYEQS